MGAQIGRAWKSAPEAKVSASAAVPADPQAKRRSPPPTFWIDERVTLMKDGFDEGKGFSQIAREIGHGCTRNMVIGKCNRMGWVREQPSKPAKAVRHIPRVNHLRLAGTVVYHEPRNLRPARLPVARLVDEAPGQATILSVKDGECRWPIGDPQAADFTLCGDPCEGPYCLKHHQVAHQPPDPKRSEKTLARSLRRFM